MKVAVLMMGNRVAVWSSIDERNEGPLVFQTVEKAKKYRDRIGILAPVALKHKPVEISIEEVIWIALENGQKSVWSNDSGIYSRSKIANIKKLPDGRRTATLADCGDVIYSQE